METKTCTKCKEVKPITGFYFRKDTGSYRHECKDCIKAAKAVRESFEGVKEARALKERERRAIHGDTINAKLRAIRNTPEGKAKCKETTSKFRINNPDKIKAWSKTNRHNRRNLKEANGLIDDASTVASWILEQPKVCEYCGCQCKDNYQLDHIVALTQGGTHTIDNFAIACPSCNNSKHNHSLILWIAKKRKES